MRNTASDAGSIHVLEAVVIASIMISAVAFVVTFDSSTPSSIGAAREGLEVKARDILAIMDDTPAIGNTSKFGDDVLSAAIALCLNQNCTALSENLTRLAPQGSTYALYVSNGYETYPVLVKGEPAGEAVSSSRSFEPRWSSTFLATATESVTPNDPLLTYALPIFYANPVTPDGSQLFVKVIGERADGSEYVLIASYATVADGLNEPDALAASLYFVSHTGEPLPVLDLSGHTSEAREVRLRLEESEGGRIPEGVEVTVHVPRGWTASAPVADNPAWTILSNADDRNGSYVGSAVRARLGAPLSSAAVDLKLQVTYHGDVLDYYPFVATLSRGATGVASMLVKGESHETDPAIATPELIMSVPNPMGNGAPTTWTLSAYVPMGEGSLPGGLSGAVTVKRIEIIEKDDNAIFGTVDEIASSSTDSTWTSGGTDLVWTGSQVLDYDHPLNLSFTVHASGKAGPSDARAPFIPPVTFDAWTGRLVERSGWGFYRQALLPADSKYLGFNSSTSGLGIPHPLETEAVYRSTELPGRITYNVSRLGSVEDSLYGSYVTAESHDVAVGGEVVINANVQSLLFALTEAGQSAGVTLRFYPPWSGDDRVPIFEQTNLDQGLLSGEVSQLVLLDINSDGHLDPVIGTTNGRVIAYHGLTGQRLQGNTWIAPLAAGAEEQAVPRITTMSNVNLYGDDYIVVGTDKNSEGIYVLAKNFTVRWKFAFDTPEDVLAIDSTISLTGDSEPEIVVARSQTSEAARNAVTYVFRAPQGTAWGSSLIAVPAAEQVSDDPQALYESLGTPTTILAQSRPGPFGDRPGVLVPTQTLLDPGLSIDEAAVPPVSRGATALPRAGVQGVNHLGESTSTLFGAPASVLRSYSYGGDTVDDVLLGGASGYVTLSNGTVLTQPLYSYVMNTAGKVLDADTLTSAESYILTVGGPVRFTTDAWAGSILYAAPAVGGNAIAARQSEDVWIVGAANQIWRSVELVEGDPSSADIVPWSYTAKKAGVDYDLLTNVHEYNDIWFRDQTGYVVGTPCALLCTEPIILRTLDAGATWDVLGAADTTLVGTDGISLVAGSLNSVEVFSDGTGWAVGDAGLVLRKSAGSETWQQIAAPFGTTYDLTDITCAPGALDKCVIVGETGAAYRATDARTTPSWTNLTGRVGLPGDRDLYSVGYAGDDRIYVGSHNMVLASFQGSNFSALPLNYIENDGTVVSTPPDGSVSGFIYGGSANGRIWLIHDYHIQSQAKTKTFSSLFPEGSKITGVQIQGGDVTFAGETIVVNVTTNGGTTWDSFGELEPDPDSASTPKSTKLLLSGGSNDLRFLITFNTSGESTVHTPAIHALSFTVEYDDAGTPRTRSVWLDLSTTAQVETTETTADWNTTERALRQPFVQEYWTRNVTGEVHDIQTGYDVTGDTLKDVWVGTGDVLAENSPDYVIYAGVNTSKVVDSHNRVYLLDGKNGHPAAISPWLDGEVRQIRLANNDADPAPDVLYAATWNTSTDVTEPPTFPYGRLYALDPVTLDPLWNVVLGRQEPVDMELALVDGPHDVAYVGTQRPTGAVAELGQLWALNGTTHNDDWAILPDDLGKYIISTTVQPGWLFGPYVVEIEVEWEETVVDLDITHTVLRSARFYDHFMVTPPDLVSPPTPVYTARLLLWMNDWG